MVNDILALAATGGTTLSDVLIFAGVPILLSLVAGVWAVFKGLLRFTQFMVRSEATSRSIADSNVEIRDKLDETNTQLTDFAEKTNSRLGAHDQALAVLNYVLGRSAELPGIPSTTESLRKNGEKDVG
jgi:hypothetical protein